MSRLHVSADLRLDVTAPDGRTARVVVRDDGGTVRVELARTGDLSVLRSSLPAGLPRLVGQGVRRVRDGSLPLPPWEQPVEVSVGGEVVLRRRAGRWSPAPRLAGPAAGVLAVLLVVAGVVVAVTGRLRRGR